MPDSSHPALRTSMPIPTFGPLLARRDLIRFGSVGVAASALPAWLPAVESNPSPVTAQSVIVLWMAGGLTHIEWLGSALLAQGAVLAAQGDKPAAQAALREALAQLQASVGDEAPATREARALLAGS